MVIPLRTIFYGIPILIVGVLAALPFRRPPQPEIAKGAEQASSADDWGVSPIKQVSAADFADWEREHLKNSADPMQPWNASIPPIPDSYQAVAIPLERPRKIADRYSAVVSADGETADQAGRSKPLVGHPATFASTGIPRSSRFAQPNAGWKTAIPIGRPPGGQEDGGGAATPDRLAGQTDEKTRDGSGKEPFSTPVVSGAPSILPPPRPTNDSRTSPEPWPTLTELAKVNEFTGRATQSDEAPPKPKPSDRSTENGDSVSGTARPTSSVSELNRGSSAIRGTSNDNETSRERFFIREPTS